MSAPATLSVTDRFALIIDGLCAAVAARIAARTMTAALIVLIWRRLRRINTNFQALAARIQAGKLRVFRPRSAGARCPTPPDPARRSDPPPLVPRGFAWLLALVPSEAACFADGFRRVFADPEMAALIAATPRMGRLLRPLCNMLGIEADFLPALPKRRRREMAPAAGEIMPAAATRVAVRRARAPIAERKANRAAAELAIRSDIRPWYDFLAVT